MRGQKRNADTGGTGMEKNILVVEDDIQVREGLKDILEANGYLVYEAYNEKTTMGQLLSVNMQTIILDINLGDENGFDLCRKIRLKSNVPILFLTAQTGEMELVRGFSIGGDDYLTRRYSINEADTMWTSGDIAFDRSKYQVLKKGIPLELTPVEVKLVYTLMNAWPASMTREQLLYDVWDKGMNFVEENTLNVNVSRLREKLGKTPDGEYVGTIRGVGYRWNQDVRK